MRSLFLSRLVASTPRQLPRIFFATTNPVPALKSNILQKRERADDGRAPLSAGGLNATSRSYDGPLFRPTDVQAYGDARTIVGVPLERKARSVACDRLRARRAVDAFFDAVSPFVDSKSGTNVP